MRRDSHDGADAEARVGAEAVHSASPPVDASPPRLAGPSAADGGGGRSGWRHIFRVDNCREETRFRPKSCGWHEGNWELDFWWFMRIFHDFWRNFLRILETTKIMKFKEHWPWNSIRGKIWPQIWNVCPQTTYATMSVWTVVTFLDEMAEKRKKDNSPLLELSALPQLKTLMHDANREGGVWIPIGRGHWRTPRP